MDPRSDYHMYLPELREDFHYMCGYCGKTEKITKNAFEIDHFIPRKYAEDRKNDYNNLVYSCYVCNRKKSSKWLSKDSNVQFKLRPMKEVWQLMMLVEKKEELRKKMRSLASDEKDAYIEIDKMVEMLQELLFQNKE